MAQVKISDGVIEGEYLKNEFGGNFYSFKGIPYAAPPVGDLRFKAPQPVIPWNGVFKATQLGPKCYQIFDLFTGQFQPSGSEDCLYLNVYTPEIKPAKPLPVMVYIHGGAFVCGSGDDDIYGPEFLVRQGVILVTINYRLDALGFLCLDTEEIPGNAGMKDQVAALRWVNKNIANFGGDPNNVTIFGESAGAASVSFHLISPMSKGLFRRAIAQSGAAICPWATNFQPRDRALLLARKLGSNSEDDNELNKFFKSVPVWSLCGHSFQLPIVTGETQKSGIYFNIVSEKKFGNNERFFYDDLYKAARTGIHEDVEVMTGFTEHEGFIMIANNPIGETCDKIIAFVDYLAPKDIRNNCKLADVIDVSKSIKKYYFGNQAPSEENWEIINDIAGFESFKYGVIQSAKFSAYQNKKTYLYKFTCKSERNIFAQILGVGKLVGDKAVTSHVDDLAYLFPEKILDHQPIKDSTMKMIDNITRLWTNFAKFGNPTPDESLGVRWEPYTLQTQKYLNIGNSLEMGEQPDKAESDFWESFHRKYVPDQLLDESSWL